MSDTLPLPVGETVLTAWRQFAARPDYLLRVGWVPAGLIFGAGALSQLAAGGPPEANFWQVVLALLNFAVLVQALVAWQRYALPESHPRKGITGLRAGRPEFFSLLHFPLVGILFVPLLIPTLIESLTGVQEVADGFNNLALGLAGLALVVFPGGLVLMRAALLLTAIAAAGRTPISLPAAANRVWAMSAGNSIRLLVGFYLTIAPAAVGLALLPIGMPPLARTGATAILVPFYVMLAGGALAVAYGRLAAVSGGARKAVS
jgi:hypothetical protein